MARSFNFQSSFLSPHAPAKTMDFLSSPRAVVMFDGYQMVPAINSVSQQGNQWTLKSRWRRVHKERVLVKTDSQLWLEIYPAFPEKFFYRSITERFILSETADGCQVQRSMSLSARPGMGLLAAWGKHMLTVAVERNNHKLQSALQQQPQPEPWM